MKKVISMAAVAVLCSTSALFAETSGVFLGAEIGYGAGKFENKITTNGANQNANYDGGGIKYSVVVGYKQFLRNILVCAIMQISALHTQSWNLTP